MDAKLSLLIPVWETGIFYRIVVDKLLKKYRSYFFNVNILHCGPKSEYDKCNQYLKDNINIKNINFEYFDYKGVADTPIQKLINSVENGDWGLLLDSDQIPEKKFLDNFRSITKQLIDKNSYLMLPTSHHEWNQDNILNISKEAPLTYTPDTYCIRPLFQKNETTAVQSNKGFHYTIVDDKNKSMLYLPYHIVHLKLYFEYFSSIFLCGWKDPYCHTFTEEEIKNFKDQQQYLNEFEQLKKKTNVLTSNKFMELCYNNSVPNEFIEFFSNKIFSKETNKCNFLSHAFKFCTEYNFNFNESFKHKRECNCKLCN